MIDTIDHDAIRELRLSRPPANALGPDLLADLQTEAFEEALFDQRAKAV